MDKYSSQDLLISLNDIKKLCLKKKGKIILAAIIFSLIAIFYSLTKPVEYSVEGTFKEKGKVFGGMGSSLSLAAIMGTNIGGDSEAITMMKSRKLMDKVIDKLDLQGTTVPDVKSYFSFPNLQNIKINWMIQKAYWNNAKAPVLPDFPTTILQAVNIDYKAETPILFDIKLLDEDQFQILSGKTVLAEGMIGQPVQIGETKFTLIKNFESNLPIKQWKLILWPLKTIADGIVAKISFEPDRMDKSLIRIKYANRDRQKAALVITTMMGLYQDYLREEQNRIANEQIKYLEKRQTEMDKTLREMMDDYALNLATDLSSTGFTDSHKAMEFLAQKQAYYKQKLLDMELEGRRLQKALQEGYAYYDAYTSYGDPTIINHILSQIRTFKQQADSIEIALREEQLDKSENHLIAFEEQVKKARYVKECCDQTAQIIKALDQNELPPVQPLLWNDSRFMVKAWYDKLKFSKTGSEEQFSETKNSFKNYLQALQHFFKVYEKVIEERLVYQQNQEREFQGIDINIAKELYIGYSRQLDDVEAQAMQNQFIVEQMRMPDFEISSLSSILTDSVSRDMIHRTSTLILNLKDENNRSVREQDRLKEQIGLQKEFLSMHLQQIIQLLGLRKDLLKEKIRALQSVTLALTHQQISILEKHLTDYFKTRLKDLKQEREIIVQHQGELRAEMAALPTKWVAETLINQQVEMNKRMVEEVSRLVESKNISNNLEMVQSAPLDPLNIPLHPKPPRIIFFAVLGAMAGSLFAVTFFVVKSIIQGVPASEENLRLSGQKVAGLLSSKGSQAEPHSLYDSDLQTLRRLTSMLEPLKDPSILVLKGSGIDFTKQLAFLLHKKDYRVVILALHFNTFDEGAKKRGVLQFLEGEDAELKIDKLPYCDYVCSGGISRYGHELLGTAKFKELIDLLKAHYDVILVSSDESILGAQAEGLTKLFSQIVVEVTSETLNSLGFYLETSREKNIYFILHDEI